MPRAIAGVLILEAIFGCLLFGPIGTLRWARGWEFLGALAIAATGTMAALLPARTGILKARFQPPFQKGQPLSDKIVLAAAQAASYGSIEFAALDARRFRLLGSPGSLASLLGLALFFGGWTVITLALRENPFAIVAVRLQRERGQRVIDTGVYSVVRHPMYAGAVPFFVGATLFLGSYAAALSSVVPIALFALRAVLEERFLRRGLEGYDAYTRKVRFRLLPFVW